MKKESFRYLYSFKYNGKEYIYLMAKNYPFYFLEYNSSKNSFDYPSIDVFNELYNKFYNDDELLYFNKIDSLKKLIKLLNDININLVPFVKTTTGLITLTLALSLCGCSKTKDINVTNNIATIESSNTTDDENKEKEIYNYFKNYNMEVTSREYNGNDYIFVDDFINNDNKHQITIQTYDDFRKFKNIDFIPTWDDVIEAFENNQNIDDDKKNIILDGINNLKNSEDLKNIDLTVLYVNAKRMSFKYLSSMEIANNVNRDSIYAYFDAASGIVYLPNDKPLEKFEFIHEVLGHGLLAYREETKDSLFVFDCTNYLMLPTENNYTGYSAGIMVSEGGANMIAHLATNDYSVSTFYELYEEELRVIAGLCDVSIGELLNHKGISLYDLMYENNIDTPVEYIFKMDALCKGKMYCEFSYLMERLFLDATGEKIANSTLDEQNNIISETIKIIKDSYFKDKKELNFNYNGGTINYNFLESANKYEENINQLRGLK